MSASTVLKSFPSRLRTTSTPAWLTTRPEVEKMTTNDVEPVDLINGIKCSWNDMESLTMTKDGALTLLEARAKDPMFFTNWAKTLGIFTVDPKANLLKQGWNPTVADDWTNHSATGAINDGHLALGKWLPTDKEGATEAYHRLARVVTARLTRLSKELKNSLTGQQKQVLEKTPGHFHVATYVTFEKEPSKVYTIFTSHWDNRALGNRVDKPAIKGTLENYEEGATVGGIPTISTPGGRLFASDVADENVKSHVILGLGSVLTNLRKNLGLGASVQVKDDTVSVAEHEARTKFNILHEDMAVRLIDQNDQFMSVLLTFATEDDMKATLNARMPDRHQTSFAHSIHVMDIKDVPAFAEIVEEKGYVIDSGVSRQLHDINRILKTHQEQGTSLDTALIGHLHEPVKGWTLGPKSLKEINGAFTQKSFKQTKY